MSDPVPQNAPRCPQTHADDSSPPLVRVERVAAGPVRVWLFPGGPEGLDAIIEADAGKYDGEQLELPEPAEFFDPRQTHFDFRGDVLEGGAR